MKHVRLGVFVLAMLPALPVQQDTLCSFTAESRAFAEKRQFQPAMRALSEDLAKWDRCIASTRNNFEGARELLRARVLDLVSQNGDAQWGAILDDARIPYRIKTDMLFEILEHRLGKGAVYLANEETIIVPRNRPVDLDREMIRLPKK